MPTIPAKIRACELSVLVNANIKCEKNIEGGIGFSGMLDIYINVVWMYVCMFVKCCLATKSLNLNNTKWNGWR